MYSAPRVLHVDTTIAPDNTSETRLWQGRIDYRCYARTSSVWRRLEQALRLDIGLARQAIALAKSYDVLLCGSEKVAIPLALLGCPKPIVTVVHNVARRPKAQLINLLGVAQRWAKVGVYTKADAQFVVTVLGCKAENTFNYASAPVDRISPGPAVVDGVILSTGSTWRDYPTLLAALSRLPGCRTEIYSSSRYSSSDERARPLAVPSWVSFMPHTPNDTLISRLITAARFVVVPLHLPSQYGAGGSAILEAMSAAKAVVATETHGTIDYVRNGVTGFLVPPGDSSALRDAIRALWQNPELAHRMGLAGRAFAEAHYNPVHVNQGIRAALAAAHRGSIRM